MKLVAAKDQPPYLPVIVERNADWPTVARVEARLYELPGVVVEVAPSREYPHGKVAPHLLGYLGEVSLEQLRSGNFPHAVPGDLVGKYGIEVLDGRGGVNPSLFHPAADRKAAGGGPMRILYYGRLSRPRKGTRFVLKAAEAMYRDGMDVELVLFDASTPGSGDPRVGFDPGMPFRFYIDLPQERMASMYASADVFASAEHRAGWSNTCAEAAACGLPLVCTGSGTTDFALDGRTALVVRRNSLSIGRALRKLYRDREAAMEMGREGAHVMLDFTWDRVCDTMRRQFVNLLEETGGREE
jgi:glycosyltransferase involved in cell wall biosynthesis